MSDHYAASRARFLENTVDHEMSIIRDDGLYRHLRFMRSEEAGKDGWRSAYFYDLITWPGYLAIVGDAGDYLFSRIRDMFEFFELDRGGINPDYWAEKLRGPGRHDEASRNFSPDKFRACVLEWQRQVVEDGELGYIPDERTGTGPAREVLAYLDEVEFDCSEADIERVLAFREEVSWKLLGEDPWSEEDARRRLSEFSFSFERWSRRERLHVEEPWGWDFREWDGTFLWCCWAIATGIERYRAATREAVAA